ncbi:MAG TPA: glucose 1-dehydrogenase [Chloroflexota bacterium]|jgi:NAD(P)-dependent dehydrogenase (short-subunit alcohol dehydrogenase family)
MAVQRFSGKVALVTGAASGIGRAAALLLAREGARVAVVDIDADGGAATCRQILEAGGEASFVPADVGNAASVHAMVEAVMTRYGRLDCAFNNAGLASPFAPLADFAEDAWDRIMTTNLKGVWLCMKYEIPVMRAQGGGTIVNTSSGTTMTALLGAGPYAASKAGIIQLTRVAALENADAGLRINTILPGMTRTPPIERRFAANPAEEPEKMAQYPLGRIGTPEEIAEAAAWLLSDQSTFVTGHALVADGGVSLP